MGENVLITGGAGFIGRAVTRELLRRGNAVRVLDSLVDQVHGGEARPQELSKEAELIVGDIRNKDVVMSALNGIDSVVHLAAEVGVAQSMYTPGHYTSVNEAGSAILFEALMTRPVRRVVTASSMSIYGEGLYEDVDGETVEDAERADLTANGGWDPVDSCGRPLKPIATPEWKKPSLVSIYALGKYVQERQTLIMTSAYGMEGTCLRLFNVYGPGQALSNPYTGALAIFSSRLLSGERPLIFEDGDQRRDFIYVGDVARAFAEALVHPDAAGGIFNVGSGQNRTIAEVARSLAEELRCNNLEPEISNKGRTGDIRHCFGDCQKAATILGFQAEKDFQEGLQELVEWVAAQTFVNRYEQARAELETRGLIS